MKRILWALIIFCAFATGAQAQEVYQRKYATEAKINFALWETDGTDLKVDAADGGSDCNIIKDEGTETTCTNDFVDEGNTYSITLSSTEMTAARVSVCIIDSATKVYLDKCIVIETYGPHESAQHPDATIALAQSATGTTITLAAAENYADDLLNNNTSVVILSGTGAGQIRCITDWDQSDDQATVATWTTNPDNTSRYTLIETPNCNGAVGTNGITAASIATNAIDDDSIAADVSLGSSSTSVRN